MHDTTLAGAADDRPPAAAWAPAAAPDAHDAALADWLAARAGATAAHIGASGRLHGGAVRENWGLEVTLEGGPLAGHRHLVLRTHAPARLAESRPLAQEFAILCTVHAAGVRVPEPLWLAEDGDIIGRPFFVMARVPGVAGDRRIVRAAQAGGWGAAVAQSLGEELARLHAIAPPNPAL
ncbi:MAG: phosphotransferase, partial [Proteobacteria bacterium]|nr:phosphotransferase [Pseudomonadota bacterium]